MVVGPIQGLPLKHFYRNNSKMCNSWNHNNIFFSMFCNGPKVWW